MTAVVNLIPDGYFSNKDLERLLIELHKVVQQKEVLRIEDAAEFLSCSVRKINHLCQHDKLPYHRIDGLSGKVFLRSELIDFIKKS